MGKRYLFYMFLLLYCIYTPLAQAEEKITLSTYYPAPYGEYDQLAADSMVVGRTYPFPADDNLIVEGSVGIGRTNPSVALQIADSVGGVNLALQSYTHLGTRYSNWDTWLGQNIRVIDDVNSSGVELATSHIASGASALNIGFNSLNFYQWPAASLSGLSTGSDLTLPAPSLAINSSGNVGIGTTSPAQKLEVAGNIELGINNKLGWRYSAGDPGPYAYIQSDGAASGLGFYAGSYTGGQSVQCHNFYTYTSGWVNRLMIRQDGNVGIGTTVPATKLNVDYGAYNTELIRASYNNNAHSVGLGVEAYGTYWGAGIWQDGVLRANFENNGLAIGNSYSQTNVPSSGLIVAGNVGIGMASPELQLTVTGRGGAYGAALFRNASYSNTFSILPHPGVTYLSSGIYYNGSWIHANDNSYNQLFAMSNSTGARWYASSTGSGSWNLASNVLLWNNSGTWVGSSSRALKENFTQLNPDDILQKIDQLDITRWNFKSEGKSITHIGPVAEDFYRIFKTGDADNHLATIDTAGVSLAGVKALSEKVKIQEQKIERLQKTIEEISKRES